ncbi:MAG: GtrA family protein [Rickettsiales bacterium]|jgi:putative flippase GtrA|nr:GtrA family protein [Rickettsiales bacterium]
MKRFIKFAIVGGCGTLVNLFAFAILQYRIGVGAVVASALAFVIAASFNYVFNRIWVFADRGKARSGALYLKFMLVSSCALLVNIGVLWFSEKYLMPSLFSVAFFNFIFVWSAEILNVHTVSKITSLYSQAIGIGVAMVLNFLGNNFLTFRRK